MHENCNKIEQIVDVHSVRPPPPPFLKENANPLRFPEGAAITLNFYARITLVIYT